MQIFPIVSSSEGNCTFIKTDSAAVLIDCGISYRQLSRTLGREQVGSLDAVFITHEHLDHIKGLDALASKKDLPVYINPGSYWAKVDQLHNIDNRILEAGRAVKVGNLTLTPFEVIHDAANTFGFYITEDDGADLCFLTDTGLIADEMLQHVSTARNLIIECNYNEQMLSDYSGYPSFLKSRIAESHLSNRQTLDLLGEIDLNGFDNIIPAHLSPRTNSPEQLRAEILERFPENADKFMIAPLLEPIILDREYNAVFNHNEEFPAK